MGDLIVEASSTADPIVSAVFSWTNPTGVFSTFIEHGVQGDGVNNAYFSRGTGPFASCPANCGSHHVITVTAASDWVMTGFSVTTQVNDPDYLVDIFAAQGNALTLLGSITVHGGPPSVQSLSGLQQSFTAGPAQIVISPRVFSPTGSGYLLLDDIVIQGQ